ncbi:MAG: hypothetical protein MJK13_16740 [Pseudomonadales bacterium]|nr:hypothetical protein [Pseudomonadales bacterium]
MPITVAFIDSARCNYNMLTLQSTFIDRGIAVLQLPASQPALGELQLGESAIKHAPQIKLSNGESCVPQHYLLYSHCRASVEKIVLDIEYSDNYPIFVAKDKGGVYLQIGIIGVDNYPGKDSTLANKLVYGRKWRVEPVLPTSEVIQTVFLALKTAREHEVRELFSFCRDDKTTTPFNNHHDLPVLARLAKLLKKMPVKNCSQTELQDVLAQLRYDHAKLHLLELQQRSNGSWLIDISIVPTAATQLVELVHKSDPVIVSILLPTLSANQLYYQLMDSFIKLSEQHIENNFSYRGFKRFCRDIDVLKISDLSLQLRQKPALTEQLFIKNFKQANYSTDKTRVPSMATGALRDKILRSLEKFPELQVTMPVRRKA